MRTHVALLRGINVGGNKKIKMADLKATLCEIGFSHVETLLQSGNVAFQTSDRSREDLEKTLKEATKLRFGMDVEYFVRTAKEWEVLIAANPFPAEAESDPSHLLAVLVRETAEESAVDALQAAISGPEKIRLGKDVFYVTYPAGIGASTVVKTPGWNKLVGVGTGRNWNTVLKLSELLWD